MKIKKTYIVLIIVLMLILVFAVNQRPKESTQNAEKAKVEEMLNKEIIDIPSEVQEETPQNVEDDYEERVRKMYEMLPPGEVITE